MKFAYLAILPFLAGCSVVGTTNAGNLRALSPNIDATSEGTISWLHEAGYKSILITGLRTEDCDDDHVIIGHGVIVKALEDTEKPIAISGVVCVGWDGVRLLEVDAKNE